MFHGAVLGAPGGEMEVVGVESRNLVYQVQLG